ncbi:MAG TPA: MFS transporter [Marinilabiliales bacterium]|nr:MFS transporter [Marinilabiliales bacterium]
MNNTFINNNTYLPHRAWLTVFLLFLVALLNYLDRIMLVTMRSSVIDSIPMSEAQFGMLTSIFLWVYAALSPIAGYLADRFKRSHVIIMSLIVWSLVTWLTGHASSYNQLLFYRALMGISEAFYIPAAFALIVDYHRGRTQSLATGIHLAGVMLGQSLGFIGGWIAEQYSWNLAFNSFGIVGVVYAVVLILLLRDPEHKGVDIPMNSKVENDNKKIKVGFGEVLKVIFSKPAYIYLLVFWCVLGLVSWMISAWLPTYYQENYGLSQTRAGLFATAYLYPFSIAGAILSGVITDKWSVKNKYARVLVPMIGLLIAAPCVFMASYTSMFVLAIIFFMVYGLTRMTVDNNMMPIMCLFIDNKYRATAYGIMNMFNMFVGGLGIYLIGAMRDMNVEIGLIYQIAALSLVLGVFILYFVKRNIKIQQK